MKEGINMRKVLKFSAATGALLVAGGMARMKIGLVLVWIALLLMLCPMPAGAPPNRPGFPPSPGGLPGPGGEDFPPGDPKYGERTTLIREGVSGVISSLVCVARGALLTDDFGSGDMDFQTWRLMPFINREWVSLKDGALSIAGRLQRPQKNILFGNFPGGPAHLGVVSRRFPTADVVAVMRMQAVWLPVSQGGEWNSMLHVCSAIPDHFSEVRFGSLREGGYGWSFFSKDEQTTFSGAIPAFGDEATRFYTVKVERDGPSRVMTGYVEGTKGWVKLGEARDTHLFSARVEIKTAGNTDGVDLDTRFDDIRLYPHPDRNPMRFVVTSSFPRFAYPVSGAESLGLKLYRADGITLIGEGKRAADSAFEVPLSRELTFPIGAVIKLFRDGGEVGSARITATGVEGLYPGDVWAVNL